MRPPGHGLLQLEVPIKLAKWRCPTYFTHLLLLQLPRADAEAALRHCHGDGDEALLYAVQCHSQGGAAAVAQKRLAAASASTSGQQLAQVAAEQARMEADLQEALQVLARVTANKSTIQ